MAEGAGVKLALPIIAKLDKDALRRLREYDFAVAVTKYAEEHEWKCHYARSSAVKGADGAWRGTGPKGWPDLFCIRRGVIRAFELKSEVGRATPEQRAWLAALDQVVGAMTMVAKPQDAALLMRLLD